jgi:methylated-DNA-[protein]-cysteine S-methyltransferase
VNQLKYHLFQAPLGWIGMLGNSDGLRQLTLKPTFEEALEELRLPPEGADPDPNALAREQSCLERYFQGDLDALDEVQLDLTNSPPFFRAAWDACRRIPPGETRSYSWLAAEAGNPRAFRAAGQSMARNRIALVIPCHRVIGNNGDLHGYGAGGLRVKAHLLELERRVTGGLSCPGHFRA